MSLTARLKAGPLQNEVSARHFAGCRQFSHGNTSFHLMCESPPSEWPLVTFQPGSWWARLPRSNFSDDYAGSWATTTYGNANETRLPGLVRGRSLRRTDSAISSSSGTATAGGMAGL